MPLFAKSWPPTASPARRSAAADADRVPPLTAMTSPLRVHGLRDHGRESQQRPGGHELPADVSPEMPEHGFPKFMATAMPVRP